MQTGTNSLSELIKTYPKGGGYHWDNDDPTDGVTQPIVYQGVTLLSPDEKKSTYCCGLTFEVWFLIWGHKLQIPVKEMRQIQQLWYVAVAGKRRGMIDAMVPRGLAHEVKYEDIRDGEPYFGQIWRANGSGHSVVPLRKAVKETIEWPGLTYWSTQPATDGPGERSEYFSGKNPITEIYICRPL